MFVFSSFLSQIGLISDKSRHPFFQNRIFRKSAPISESTIRHARSLILSELICPKIFPKNFPPKFRNLIFHPNPGGGRLKPWAEIFPISRSPGKCPSNGDFGEGDRPTISWNVISSVLTTCHSRYPRTRRARNSIFFPQLRRLRSSSVSHHQNVLRHQINYNLLPRRS